MLKFPSAWRFESPSSVPVELFREVNGFIGKIAGQGEQQRILEHFKSYFSAASGAASSWSSNASWAETDLYRYMEAAEGNAPLFIEAFYEACESLYKKEPELSVPNLAMINRVLSKHTEYEIQPPNLIFKNYVEPIPVREQTLSLDDQTRKTIQESLKSSDELLSEGRDRLAVQEILWLLETISTAFQGLDTEVGTVEGRYFNKIVGDLRRHYKGKTLEQALIWITNLHGYLSSPTGGGVRHGSHLKEGIAIQPHEARLFCNLTRSYIDFLIAEHEKIKTQQPQKIDDSIPS